MPRPSSAGSRAMTAIKCKSWQRSVASPYNAINLSPKWGSSWWHDVVVFSDLYPGYLIIYELIDEGPPESRFGLFIRNGFLDANLVERWVKLFDVFSLASSRLKLHKCHSAKRGFHFLGSLLSAQRHLGVLSCRPDAGLTPMNEFCRQGVVSNSNLSVKCHLVFPDWYRWISVFWYLVGLTTAGTSG